MNIEYFGIQYNSNKWLEVEAVLFDYSMHFEML